MVLHLLTSLCLVVSLRELQMDEVWFSGIESHDTLQVYDL